MGDYGKIILIAITQGLTEFLPVSSSGHLLLLSKILNIKKWLTITVMAHLGSLIAIVIAYFKDFKEVLKPRYLTYILIGTVPCIFTGLFLKSWIEGQIERVYFTGIFLLITASFLILSDFFKSSNGLSYVKSLIIGIAQSIAVFPGISRSGVTISTGIFCGVKREEACRFGFLLGIPAIGGATLLELPEIKEIHILKIILTILLSFVFSLLAIKIVIKFALHRRFKYFGYYCIFLGFILLFSGCKLLPPRAGGKDTEIICVANKEVRNLLSQLLEEILYTPSPENRFVLKFVTDENFGIYKYRKNILICEKLGEPLIDTLLSREIKEKIKRGEANIFSKDDMWIRGQSVLIVGANNEDELKEIIKEKGDMIKNYFILKIMERFRKMMYEKGFREDLHFKHLTRYGFAIKIPYGWIVAKDTFNFIKIIRHFPDRVISIYWEGKPRKRYLTKKEAIALRNYIGKNYYNGDFVYEKDLKFYYVKFKGFYAQKMEGIWQNDKEVMGGPFVTYFFSTDKRFYVIDMHVFAPGETKWTRLLQLEVIADTFEEL